jgi:hypothetical protein
VDAEFSGALIAVTDIPTHSTTPKAAIT